MFLLSIKLCIFHLLTVFLLLFKINFINSKLVFRNVKRGDISNVANLCAECFNGPFGILEVFKKKQAINTFETQLSDRFQGLIEGGAKHVMILGEDTDNHNKIIGFMELGTMPSPISTIKEWEGKKIEIKPEIPFLGNVVVDEDQRRKGIGSKLVKLALKCVESKWKDESMFLTVEADNLAAIKLYGKLKFDIILDESDNLNQPVGRVPRLFFMRSFNNNSDDNNDGDNEQ